MTTPPRFLHLYSYIMCINDCMAGSTLFLYHATTAVVTLNSSANQQMIMHIYTFEGAREQSKTSCKTEQSGYIVYTHLMFVQIPV